MATANTLTSDRPVNGSVVCDGEVVAVAETVDRVVAGAGVVCAAAVVVVVVVVVGAGFVFVLVAAGAIVAAWC
jgi:hypothetical protein